MNSRIKNVVFELQKLKPCHAEGFSKHANNKKVTDNMAAIPYPYELKDAIEFINKVNEKDESRQMVRAIVVDGEAVGSVGVFCLDGVYGKSAAIGYWLGEEFWGKGIMTKAVNEMCADAFFGLDICRIFAEIFDYNTCSKRVLEKAGFVYEGTKKKSVFKNGKYFDSLIYALVQ